MKKSFKIGKVSTEQMLKMDRAISREIELSDGMRINHHRVVASKKSYTRKSKHKLNFA